MGAGDRPSAELADNFYSGDLTEEERERLPAAARAEGLHQEITALRVKLGSALKDRPNDWKLALEGMNTLLRMVVAEHRLSPRAANDLANNLAALLNQMADQFLPSDR
jgi:hypothetical protein